MKKVLAFDFGASSGRAILGKLENGKITCEEIHRFENSPRMVGDTFCWDFTDLMNNVKEGIKKAGEFDSIGIDTWGVDFGLIDENGNLLSDPVHYRDARTDNIPKEVFETVSAEEIYNRTGIQFMNFNTLFQLYYMSHYKKEELSKAKGILFMPDLFAYYLTGNANCEYTIASTSQMLNGRNWDSELLSKLAIPENKLNNIVKPGTVVGKVKKEICAHEPEVIAVCSHDTASAVVSVPAEDKDFVYISCGTWSLFGTELPEPLILNEGKELGYTNEGGYNNTIRYLTNIIGLWLIQETRRELKNKGRNISFAEMAEKAAACEPLKCIIDPDDPSFTKPGDMIVRIKDYLKKTNQYVPETEDEIFRCIYDSLALRYKDALIKLEKLTGKKYNKIHMVGGGINAKLLCKFTADACGVEVVAGPVEATAMGNIAVQYMALGEIKDLSEAREIIKNSEKLEIYTPENTKMWEEAYNKYYKG